MVVSVSTTNIFLGVFYLLAIVVAGGYAFEHRKKLDCMNCMMAGMIFGAMAGLAFGTLFALETGDFVWGTIFGTVIGAIAGVGIGISGGAMGAMEGMMAAPMGGLMGSMTGIMVRAYDVELFLAFFTVILLVTLAGMSYLIHEAVQSHHRLNSA